MKAYQCVNCKFLTYEKNKICPICEDNVEEVNVPNRNEKTFSNPIRIKKLNQDVNFNYYCYKCKKYGINKICMDCNVNCYLGIEIKEKRYVLNRIRSLSEVYSPSEVKKIVDETSTDDKELIYRNLEEPSRFFYRKDKGKSYTCIFIGILIYIAGFAISTQNYNDGLLSSIANAVGNGVFTIFLALGIGYLDNAYMIEEEHVPIVFSVITLVLMLIYLGIAVGFDLSYTVSYLIGLGLMIIALISNLIYYLVLRKLK